MASHLEHVRTELIAFATDKAQEAYINGYEAGARAALDYIAEQWPHLAEPSGDYPGVTDTTAEHIDEIVTLIRGTL